MKPVSESDSIHTEEELRLLMAESYKSGEINQTELKYVNNVFDFDDRIAREIMVPRTEIVGFKKEATFEEILTVVSKERYTRYPVYEGDRDNIIGFINIKDFLTHGINNRITPENFNIEEFINPIIKTIETTPISDLFVKMQKERIHIAVLIDEYGGTSGIVTVEDILEEIVGEIRDEFDEDEVPDIRKINDDHYIIHAKVLVDDVANLLGIDIEHEDVDTIGGWYLTNNIDLNENEVFEYAGYTFSIYEKNGNQLHFIEVKKLN